MLNESHSRLEKQEFYSSYSLLLTIIHHYAVSKQLFRKNLYSWGINIAYYSIMFVGRLLVWITINKQIRSHHKLILLLKGEKRHFKEQDLDRNDELFIRKNRPKIVSKIEEMELIPDAQNALKNLGDILDSLSEIRTYNNYERFIISHQLDHEKLDRAFKKLIFSISEEMDNWLEFSFNIFVNYLKTLDYFGEYLAIMENKIEELINLDVQAPPQYAYFWGIESFLYSLQSQNKIVKEITNIINTKWKNKVRIFEEGIKPVQLAFFNDITYHEFTGKDRIFNEFLERIALFDQIKANRTNNTC